MFGSVVGDGVHGNGMEGCAWPWTSGEVVEVTVVVDCGELCLWLW